MSASRRSELLADVESASVLSRSMDNASITFALSGYVRPPYLGQDTYGFDGKIKDLDGETLEVTLYCDQNGRLLELEFVRWDDNNVIAPLIDTLEVY